MSLTAWLVIKTEPARVDGRAGIRLCRQFYLLRSRPLLLEPFAEIFNRLADLPAPASEALLHVPGGLVGAPCIVKPFVVCQITRGLFHFALELISFAVEFVAVHSNAPPERDRRSGFISFKNRSV